MKYLKNIGFVAISVVLFFFIWHQGASYLFDINVERKLEQVMESAQKDYEDQLKKVEKDKKELIDTYNSTIKKIKEEKRASQDANLLSILEDSIKTLSTLHQTSLDGLDKKVKIAEKALENKKEYILELDSLTTNAKYRLNGPFVVSSDIKTSSDYSKKKKEMYADSTYACVYQKADGSYVIKDLIPNEEKTEIQFTTLPFPLQVKNASIRLFYKSKQIRYLTKQSEESNGEIQPPSEVSFIKKIYLSLKTVMSGVLLAIFIAIPLGILIGLNKNLRTALNWIIQIFKPVSPVVWVVLVGMVVKSVVVDPDKDKAYISAYIAVGLCAMWATLVNTALGVSSVDESFTNVAKVLRISGFKKIIKVVLPSAFPLIFTGLRITVSVSWMVVIAIELLVQSQGLGLFVWDEYNSGAYDSNSNIIVGMFVIGFIGFLLDKIMAFVQGAISYEDTPEKLFLKKYIAPIFRIARK